MWLRVRPQLLKVQKKLLVAVCRLVVAVGNYIVREEASRGELVPP